VTIDPDVLIRVIDGFKDAKEKTRSLRDSSAENIRIFSAGHEYAVKARVHVDVTAFTNCAVHVSIISRDLANLELCVIDSWKDDELTPTLIAHFYLSTYEFLNRWPQVMFEKPTKRCLARIRGDSFSSELRMLNTQFEAIRTKWWTRLTLVRTNYAAHYDRDSSKLFEALREVNLLSFIELATDVNELLRSTAATLRLVTNETALVLKKHQI
jgi:hypothetical protein